MLSENATDSTLNAALHVCGRKKNALAFSCACLIPAASAVLLLTGAAGADNADNQDKHIKVPEAPAEIISQEISQADTLPVPYRQVLDKYRTDLEKPEDEFADDDYGYSCSIHELRHYIMPDNSRTVGYFLKDLDDDGLPELLLGVNPGCGVFGKATDIIGIYTIVNGQAKRLRCGWSRSNYTLTADRTLAHFGSSGASSNVAVQYVLQGHELHIKDGVRMTDNTPHGTACYKLTDDDICAQPLEKNAISNDEFSRFVDSLSHKARLLQLTPMPRS